MKVSSIVWLVLLLQYHAVTGQSFSGLPFKQYYNAREYQGGIQNRNITQNQYGILYIANNFGLLEYDGTEWRRFPLPNETKVRDVTISQDGHIYIAAQGDFGFFTPNEYHTLEYVSLADSLSDEYRNFDETWRVFAKGDQVIFCTFNYLFIFKKNRLDQVISLPQETADFFVVNNHLFVNSAESGLSKLTGDQMLPFDQGDHFRDKFITGILALPNNHLWISTLNNGIIIYDGNGYSPWQAALNTELKDALINSCIRLSNGDIAVGTQNEGIYVITPSGDRKTSYKQRQRVSQQGRFYPCMKTGWEIYGWGITMD